MFFSVHFFSTIVFLRIHYYVHPQLNKPVCNKCLTIFRYTYIRINAYWLLEMGKKVRVNITLDVEVVQKAKELGLNISKVSENALIQSIKALEVVFSKNEHEISTVPDKIKK